MLATGSQVMTWIDWSTEVKEIFFQMEQVRPNIYIWSTGPFDLRKWVRCRPKDINFSPEWQEIDRVMSYSCCNLSFKWDKMPTSEVPIIKILFDIILKL